MTQLPITVQALPIPASLDGTDPAAADFAAAAALVNESMRHLWGSGDFDESVRTRLAAHRPGPLRRRLLLAARSNGAIVGVAEARLPLLDNTRSAYVHVTVDPAVRRSGVGRRLYAAVEQAVAAAGRTTLMAETEHPCRQPGADGGPGPGNGTWAASRAAHVLAPRSGAGSVPRDEAAGFALANRFGLEQVERVSRLDLAEGRPPRVQLETAVAEAGSGYAVEFWQGACPEETVAGYALLKQRMSTDAPTAGLDLEEERWDAARVREGERRIEDMGARELVTAVRHLETGTLVGHTVLMVFDAVPAAAFQDDTLVLRRHRGHRLGTVLKAANLLRLYEQLPDVQRIWTWNAVENRHMLDINEALGFRPVGVSGQWQKVLRR